MAGKKPDPFTAEGAQQIAAELEQYTKQGSSREQRRRYLAQWVNVLAAKQCSVSEIVRVLRAVGVKTTRETVSGLINETPAARAPATPTPPTPKPPPPVRTDSPNASPPQVTPPENKSTSRPPHSGLRNVQL